MLNFIIKLNNINYSTNNKIVTSNIAETYVDNTFLFTANEINNPLIDAMSNGDAKSMLNNLNMTSWTESLLLFLLLFFIGLSGIVFNYRNYLVTMLCIEIMYLGITICFLIVSVATCDPKGQIYGLILLIVAAAESAIGLGVLVVLYKFGNSIDFSDYQELRG